MDEKEVSAMTEASGLTNDQAGVETSTRRMATSEFEIQRRSAMARLSAQLRQTTLEAPLRSLFQAFLLGVWIARRR